MQWLPNFVSLIRVILSPFIATYAIQGQWMLAFTLTLIASASDFFDGMLASWLQAKSKLGEEWIDPLADFALSLGVLGGYVFQDSLWTHRIWLAIVMIVSTIILKILKQQNRLLRLKTFAYGFLPLYYCAMAGLFIYIYASKALNPKHLLILNILFLPIVITLIWIKRHRFKDWFSAKFI